MPPEGPGRCTCGSDFTLVDPDLGGTIIRGRLAAEGGARPYHGLMSLISPANTMAIAGIPKGSFTRLDAITAHGTTIGNGTFRGGVPGIAWNGEDADHVTVKVDPGTWTFVGQGALPIASPKPLPPPPSREVTLDKKSWIVSASVKDGSFLFSGDKIPADVAAAKAIDGDQWSIYQFDVCREDTGAGKDPAKQAFRRGG